MTIRLGVVMDPIQSIHYKKDSTLAMLLEAQARGWELVYFEQKDLFLRDSIPYAHARKLKVFKNAEHWFELSEPTECVLGDLNIILMRKDPPFNEAYIYTTYILEHAERLGALVVNRPQSLRDANEKFFAASFPDCCPPTLMSQSSHDLTRFWQEHKDIVCKPLNTMGGKSVFRLREEEVNAGVIFETLTQNESVCIVAQRFIPEIKDGDKRVILINGEAVPFALARVPQGKDWRGNLAVGAKGEVRQLTERDRFICEKMGPTLKAKGLYFVGIDIIGDYLTEVNVTSPTGIRELDAANDISISALLFDALPLH